MPPIPTERVSTSAPFTYTGEDYFWTTFHKDKERNTESMGLPVHMSGNSGYTP